MKSMRSSDLFEAEVMSVDPETIVTDPGLFKVNSSFKKYFV